MRSTLALAALAGCTWVSDAAVADRDQDGHRSTSYGGDDCDDTDPTIQGPQPGYVDVDGDGARSTVKVPVCPEEARAEGDAVDCNDGDDAVGAGSYRDADGDGLGVGALQEGCDGSRGTGDCDDDDPAVRDTRDWYADTDGDGLFSAEPSPDHASCDVPPEPEGPWAPAPGGDCDDSDAAVGVHFVDADGDGFGDGTSPSDTCAAGVPNRDDCADDHADDQPGEWRADGDADDLPGSGAGLPCRAERPLDAVAWQPGDPVDCDDADPDVEDVRAWYADADGDLWASATADPTVTGCEPPPGRWQPDPGEDCDDSDPALVFRWADGDRDGFGDPDTIVACTETTAPWAGDDCDDGRSDIGSGAWFPDGDGDGVAPEGARSVRCEDHDASDATFVLRVLDGDEIRDCDDSNPALAARQELYVDADGDGFGAAGSTSVPTCSPAGHAAVAGDCDDDDRDRVQQVEDLDRDGLGGQASDSCGTGLWETVDCDDADDGVGVLLAFPDLDSDGFGDLDAAPVSCFEVNEGDAVVLVDEFALGAGGGDCDDTIQAIHPGAIDPAFDGFDQDCDDTDLDADDADDLPDFVAGCGVVTTVPVDPLSLSRTLDTAASCTVLELAPGTYGGVEVDLGTRRLALRSRGLDARFVPRSDDEVAVRVSGGAASGELILEGLRFDGFDAGLLELAPGVADVNLQLSRLDVSGGAVIVEDGVSLGHVGISGSSFSGTEGFCGHAAEGTPPRFDPLATASFRVASVNLTNAFSTGSLLALSASGPGNLSAVTIEHAAVTGSPLDVTADTLEVRDVTIRRSVLFGPIRLQATAEATPDGIVSGGPGLLATGTRIVENTFVGFRVAGSILRSPGPTFQISALTDIEVSDLQVTGNELEDVVEQVSPIPYLKIDAADPDLGQPDRGTSQVHLVDVRMLGNEVDADTTLLRLRATAAGPLSDPSVSTAHHLLLVAEAGTLLEVEGATIVSSSTFAGDPDVPIAAENGVPATLGVNQSVIQASALPTGAVLQQDTLYVGPAPASACIGLPQGCPSEPSGRFVSFAPGIDWERADLRRLAGDGRGWAPDDWNGAEDGDADGLVDDWERAFLGDLSLAGSADPDGDGATCLVEQSTGASPLLVDTDRDGVRDDADPCPVTLGTAAADLDLDGTPDLCDWYPGDPDHE